MKLIEAILGSQCEDKRELPFEVGEKVFIRTVTHHFTGKIEKIVGKFLVLSTAAWIADDGRFMQAINDGKLDEVEPVYCNVRLNIDTIIDVYEWKHPLPTEQE